MEESPSMSKRTAFMPSWRSGLLASVIVGIVGLFGAPAQAAVPPKNVGWLYTTNGAGAVFFDADLAGYPSWEKITVCDNVANSYGVTVRIISDAGTPEGRNFNDPSSDGKCSSYSDNFFADGYGVTVTIKEYSGATSRYQNIGYGVA
jgi:hypothetical protein